MPHFNAVPSAKVLTAGGYNPQETPSCAMWANGSNHPHIPLDGRTNAKAKQIN